MKNDHKINFSIVLSIIALTIVIAIIVIWCISTKEFLRVTEDTFISTCTGLIALALPLIIGYQIINSLDIKHSLKEGEEKSEKFKEELRNELERIQEINEKMRNSLETEKKERELIYQNMKVALYHDNTVQNSALALIEQIGVIKLIIDLGKTEELKDYIMLLSSIIKGIHVKDFRSIKPSNINNVMPVNPSGYFDLDEYEKETKIQIMNLPQINEKFTECLILVEKSLDYKLQTLKNCSIEDVDKIIDEYFNQISVKL